jgi:hypothetical protein
MRSQVRRAGVVSLVGVLSAVALVGCSSTPTQGEAETAVCDSLTELRSAAGEVRALNSDSTVDDARAAEESLSEALTAVRESGATLEAADSEALQAGADSIRDALDQVSGSDSLSAAATALQAAGAALESAATEIGDGVQCG